MCHTGQLAQNHTARDPNIYAQVELAPPQQVPVPIPTNARNIMPSPPAPWSPSPQGETELACVAARTPQGDGPPTIEFNTSYFSKKTLLHMPVEIIQNILTEWANLEWFAPAIARRICHRLKDITDLSPTSWSKLSLAYGSTATANDVRGWLRHAKAAPKEINIDVEDLCVISAALEGCKDATSIVYRTPMFEEFSPQQQSQIRLPEHMPRLCHFRVDLSDVYNLLGPWEIFEFYYPPYDGHFPCLTTLQLISIDLTNFIVAPGLFPSVRHLSLECVDGPILDLIEACSGTIEDLRVSINYWYCPQSPLHDRIVLPKLKVIIIDEAPRVVPCFDAPMLRLLHANFAELDGHIQPFGSVVEWVTRRSGILPWHVDITNLLNGMAHLQHIMLCEPMAILTTCFELLRDSQSTCPYLQTIEVVERATTFILDANLKESLRACVAWRAEKVPGFTLQFVQNDVQAGRFEKYFTTEVCLLTVMRHCLSHHAFRHSATRSRE